MPNYTPWGYLCHATHAGAAGNAPAWSVDWRAAPGAAMRHSVSASVVTAPVVVSATRMAWLLVSAM